MTAAASPAVLLDGLAVVVPIDVPGARRAERAPDWHITVPRAGQAPDEAGTVWHGDVSEDGLVWGRFGERDGRVHVHIEGIGDLLASRETGEAEVCPAPGGPSPLAALRRLMPYLASLGGRTVLHASCAQLPAGAVVFLAEAQTGKSTLALALDTVGTPILSDDHVALDPAGAGYVAHPSFAFVDVGTASRVRFRPEHADGDPKQSVPLCTAQPAGPVPVVALAFLERGETVAATPVARADTVARLLRESLFAADLLDADGHAVRLDAALALAEAVPAYRVTVPDGLDALADALPAITALF